MLGLPITDRIMNLFQTFDKDGDGSINFKEFVLGLSMLNQREDVSKREIIENSFKIFDTNDDGYIEYDEFEMVLRRNFDNISDKEIAKIYNEMDKDHDHKISLLEFTAFAINHPEYMSLAEDALNRKKKRNGRKQW